jgi:Glycosyl hydrolases family 25
MLVPLKRAIMRMYRVDSCELRLFRNVNAALILILLSLRGFAAENANTIIDVSDHDVEFLRYRAKADLNFAALREGGIRAIIFRTSIGSGKGRYLKAGFPDTDSSFDKWVEPALKQNLDIGVYHLLRPGEDPNVQADYFVTHLQALCSAHGLDGIPILLMVDAGYSDATKSVPTIEDLVRFNARVRQKTLANLGFYPEKNDAFLQLLRKSASSEVTELRRCWLWLPDFSQIPPRIQSVFWWSGWELHQYSDGTDGWDKWSRGIPMGQYAAARNPFRDPKYSVILPNVYLPLERSIFNGSERDRRRFWHQNAWVPLTGKQSHSE